MVFSLHFPKIDVCGPVPVKKVGKEGNPVALVARVIVTAEVQDIRVDGTFLFSLQPPPSLYAIQNSCKRWTLSSQHHKKHETFYSMTLLG